MNQKVHAPYHFVPLSKWVYMPEWAHLVSHDHPFEDGHSGVIEYTLRNNSPLCVGSDKDGNLVRFARNPAGIPVIPGSSLKGMLRNVLDIAGFGKFNQFDDFKLSYRDISSKSAYLDLIANNKPVPGWINYDEESEKWVFHKCSVAKIHHEEIKERLGIAVSNEDNAIKRYQKLPLSSSMRADISAPKGMKKNRWAESIGKGSTEGHLVFTNPRVLGQGDKRSYNFSYFFFNRQGIATTDNIQQQVHNLFENHRSISEKVNGQELDQVDYLQRNKHPEYGIPVFALMMRGEVQSFGFANMPRVSYKHSSLDLVDNLASEHSEDSYFSLSELLFGTLREGGYGLKSRVMFSDATLTSKETSIASQPVVLNSPKPSFLAAYIEQPIASDYASYGYQNEKETAKLAGWKRYPVMRDFKENRPSNDNENVQTRLELLTENHNFSGRIAFHNLKTEELAALIWVLTLNGSQDHYHTLGHGKSLGAGSVQFELSLDSKTNSGSSDDRSILDWVDLFVLHMNEQMVKGEWLQTPQLKHLLALCDEYISDENDFSAHDLKEFQKIKNDKAAIEPLSYNGATLSRVNSAPQRSGSVAFGKGRLSGLINKDSDLHLELHELADARQEEKQKQKKKQELTKAAQALQDAPVIEKSLGLLQHIVIGQEGATASFKKDKAKEIRSIGKELKQESLSKDEVHALCEVLTSINIAEKDVQKLIKWLEKQ
ncbi:TIGR03986 family type III CRISPR-associated RAMP protein [Vibrio breoganii]|uniref:CRISPR-associated RAMP family protein n=1 Tax=Vibrio breoganii TaxID=553239 RepID=A0AAP8SVJ2_9VIBR|nr:TIGR03986 family CRISPR-associated RAMP protein [Vibrio breoganii]PMH15932.1 CRISPR-associated RAMP family protein [Vibrio breoganii]PMM15353.1 CRISPR-associated RAMP family protein [Vibrio breoganii]PMP05877.1 CRISPR-associated RAMP family protein [Vibrio breoganii]TKG19933.1 TIGR03986 family CRISPR-associated RAMP protein [Vibrio breoganii]